MGLGLSPLRWPPNTNNHSSASHILYLSASPSASACHLKVRRMAEEYRAVSLLLALAATLPVVLLLPTAPTADAAEQRPVISGNSSLCSSGVDGDVGCLAIAEAQPELEGFEMTADLGTGVVFRRSLSGGYTQRTGGAGSRGKSGCGRHKRNYPYVACVPPPRMGGPNPQKCGTYTRGNPCRP